MKPAFALPAVMPGFMPGIHVLLAVVPSCHSGAQPQAASPESRNNDSVCLWIPGLTPRAVPE